MNTSHVTPLLSYQEPSTETETPEQSQNESNEMSYRWGNADKLLRARTKAREQWITAHSVFFNKIDFWIKKTLTTAMLGCDSQVIGTNRIPVGLEGGYVIRDALEWYLNHEHLDQHHLRLPAEIRKQLHSYYFDVDTDYVNIYVFLYVHKKQCLMPKQCIIS